MKTRKNRAAGIHLLVALLLLVPAVAAIFTPISVSAGPVMVEPIDDNTDPIPVAQLYADDEPIGSRSYTNGGYIKFVCDATCYVMLPDQTDFVPYYSGTEFHKPEYYLFYGENSAGTRTGLYSVVIDRTEKPLLFDGVIDGIAQGTVRIEWVDDDPDLYAPVKSVTVNDLPYRNGQPIYTVRDGVYHVLCVDMAGNRWESTFRSAANSILTKTLQKEYFEADDSEGNPFSFASYEAALRFSEERERETVRTGNFRSAANSILTKTLQKEYFEADDSEGNPFSFASYEAALRFSEERERETVRTGNWQNEIWDAGVPMDEKDSVHARNGVFFLYKKSGDAAGTVAYFTEERLSEVIGEYAAQEVRSYFYWEKEPAPPADGENLFAYSDGYEVLGDRIEVDEHLGILLDGEPFAGHTVGMEGTHILTLRDAWGNSCEYLVHIVRRTPTILYSVGGATPNPAQTDRIYRLKDPLTVTVSDADDAFAMFRVYNGAGKPLGCFGLDDFFPITESGTYSVTAINHSGESEPFRLMLSLNAPTVSFDEDADNRELRIQTEESPDALSRLQSVEIERSRDGGETWSALERDDRGTEISVAERSYSFQTSGKYRVRVTDAFRTGPDSATVEFDYTQPPPVFSLTGADDRGYTDRSVRFTWSDDATVSVTKNGTAIAYRSGDPLTEDGVYLITVENMDGYRKTLSFTIDTVPPELLLTGVSDGIAVNREVTVECPEENAVIEVLLEGTSLDCTERPLRLTKPGVYTVSAWDPAGNRNTASFQIVVDVTFPTLRLSGVSDGGITKKAVVLSEPSEEAVLKVYLEDEEIPYRYGDRLTGAGHYRVILTDEHGNESVYTFEIRKSANGAVIALVAVGGIAMVGIGAFLFLKKRKII